ncbi:MAG TPA: hypothetical protein VFG64_11825 [Dongiaceae bacterium]|nr:hypothetical protein [Dongiaceae bacterium]
MSSQNGAVRQPAGDLSAFDLSKRSPEEIARLFARWKQQRKALQATQQPVRGATNAPKPRAPRFMPVIAQKPAAPAAGLMAAADPQQPGPHSPRYSAPFAAVLETGSEAAGAGRLGKLQFGATEGVRERLSSRTVNPREPLPLGGASRGSKSRWVLAGAASILAVVTASGVALWHQEPSLRAGWMHVQSAAPVAVAPSVPAQPRVEAAPAADPAAARMAARLLPRATRLAVPSRWPMAVDAALMQPASPANEIAQVRLAPRLKPQPVAVRTASQGTQDGQPIGSSEGEFKADKVMPAPADHNPSAVSVAIPAASGPRSQTADESDTGTRRESVYRRGNDKETPGLRGDSHGPLGARGTRDPGKSAGQSAGSGAPGDGAGGSAGSGSDNGGGGTGSTGGGNTGSGDPGSGGTGSSDPTGAGSGGGDTGSGGTGTGDPGSGNAGSGGDTGTGGTGSGGAAGGSTGSGDTGSAGSGGSGSQGSTGGTGSGDAGSGASGAGGSGTGGGGSDAGSSGGTGGGDTGGSTGGGDTGGDTGDSTGGDSTGGDGTGGGDTGSSGSGGISGHADVDVGGGGIGGSIGGSVGGIGGSVGGSIGGGGGSIGGGIGLK